MHDILPAREPIKVSVGTVAFWVEQARGKRLDRVPFSDGKPGRAWNRTAAEMERCIVNIRGELRDKSVLGEYEADAIGVALQADSSVAQAPSRATIHRVLAPSRCTRWRASEPPSGKVWQRHHCASVESLVAVSARYIRAYRSKTAMRRESAPSRRAFPKQFKLDTPRSRERSSWYAVAMKTATFHLLGRTIRIHEHWVHRRVRCEVNFGRHRMRSYALRRRDPIPRHFSWNCLTTVLTNPSKANHDYSRTLRLCHAHVKKMFNER